MYKISAMLWLLTPSSKLLEVVAVVILRGLLDVPVGVVLMSCEEERGGCGDAEDIMVFWYSSSLDIVAAAASG